MYRKRNKLCTELSSSGENLEKSQGKQATPIADLADLKDDKLKRELAMLKRMEIVSNREEFTEIDDLTKGEWMEMHTSKHKVYDASIVYVEPHALADCVVAILQDFLPEDMAEMINDYAYPEHMIYLIGGFDGNENLREIIQCYDPGLSIFVDSIQAKMTESRAGASAWYDEEKARLYVAGGYGLRGFLDSTEYFDLGTRKWVAMPTGKLHQPRAFGDVCVITRLGKRYVYLTGGRNNEMDPLGTMERFDLERGTWDEVNALMEQGPSRGLSLCPIPSGEGMLAVGGWSGNRRVTHFSTMEYFSLSLKKWQLFHGPLVNKDRCQMGLLFSKCGRFLYAVGGTQPNGGGQKLLRSVERYDFNTKKWTMLPSDVALPCGGPLKCFMSRDRTRLFAVIQDPGGYDIDVFSPCVLEFYPSES
eukprot:CAMPEP_0184484508 /NCGR_PEP_ID=MMETSP0113_2-20130426/6218_1 /TAXON_ID=91329 /ORGANISM="Norrisiella sphaerica, Strain BC52" /LENGTH=417 /DNA_ID=CAMNT_0026865523 /DNA_START=62 /DNA_END=1315 /DNA_ORIENTATION=+